MFEGKEASVEAVLTQLSDPRHEATDMMNPIRSLSAPSPAGGNGLARLQRAAGQERAECTVCGAHAYVTPGVPRSGRCGNCGSFDLRRLSA